MNFRPRMQRKGYSMSAKQPSPIEEITTKPRICINRHEARELLKAHGIDKYVMPLINMLIQSNKSQSDAIKTLTQDNLQLMQQIESNKPRQYVPKEIKP